MFNVHSKISLFDKGYVPQADGIVVTVMFKKLTTISIERLFLWNPYVTYLLCLAIILPTCLFWLDPDFGWHLSSGQYIMQHGIPLRDIYTYTAADFPWIHHEWLADVINAVIYQAGGYTLLAWVYACMWVATLALIAKKTPLGILVITVAIALAEFSGVRAVTWTALMTALLLLLADKYQLSRWYLVAIGGLFLFWANIHGGFVIGIAYLGWKAMMQRSWKNTMAIPVALVSTLANPYGYRLYEEIFRTVFDAELRGNITEWRPLVLTICVLPLVALWGASLVISSQSRVRKFTSFSAVTFLMMLGSMRNTVIFAVFALHEMIRTFSSVRIKKKENIKKAPVIAIYGIYIGLCCVSLWYAYRALSVDLEAYYPRAIAQHLEDNPCRGNVLNAYDVGGYLIWRTPSTKVYIDGRMPSWTLNGEKYIKNFNRLSVDDAFRKQEFARYNITCVVCKQGMFTEKLAQEGWQTEYRERNGLVLMIR